MFVALLGGQAIGYNIMYSTPRQREMLVLLHSGLSYRQAARGMGVSHGTISNSLRQMAKTNGYKSATDIIEATRYVALETLVQRKQTGVYPTKAGSWAAQITVGRHRKKHVGTYRTRPQAIAARLAAEKKYRRQ